MLGKGSLTEMESKLTYLTRNLAETPISIEEENLT